MADKYSPIAKSIQALETDLNLPPGFFEGLGKEDDWSFVVKAHALLEAAMASLLTARAGKPELADVFSWLELNDSKAGKIAFAKALQLIDDDERRTVRAFSELRNKLVHRVENVRFSFEKHVAGMDANQLKQFVKDFSVFGEGEVIKHDGVDIDSLALLKAFPRMIVYYKMMALLARFQDRKEDPRVQAFIEILRRSAAEHGDQSGGSK